MALPWARILDPADDAFGDLPGLVVERHQFGAAQVAAQDVATLRCTMLLRYIEMAVLRFYLAHQFELRVTPSRHSAVNTSISAAGSR